MKAIVWTRYGPPEVLQLREVEKPAPRNDEVLIKIHAATVFQGVGELRSFKLPMRSLWLPSRIYIGLLKPRGTRILGQELAGEIEAIGKDVDHFKVGAGVVDNPLNPKQHAGA
jgi:NADPH:quinone reductase-like Zn-dependent oxidoreductase